MKTFIYFLFTCFISTGALFSALGATHPFGLYALAAGIWALFLWGWSARSKKRNERLQQEELFKSYMRSKIQHDRRHNR